MMMMQRIMETSQRVQKSSPEQQQHHRFQKHTTISDDSRDADKLSESGGEEEDDVDVENDDGLCPVDLTRSKFTSIKSEDGDSGKMRRSDSVCSDVSRSDSPREEEGSSPASVVMPHHNRRLAFSVENILDPTKFTGRQGMFSADGVCCWKPQMDATGSSEYDGSEQGKTRHISY